MNFIISLIRSVTLHIILSGGALLIWIAGLALLTWGRSFYPTLERDCLRSADFMCLPRLSILVAACNEEKTIEAAMHSLLSLEYPELEIIAVNDRSTDATGPILERMAGECPRLKVHHVTSLPEGWLGKNHALQLAADHAAGEWLLFTDADVVFEPHSMQLAVAYARSRRADHLVVSPRCDTRGFWERLFVSYFSLMFLFRFRPWDVSNPRSSAYVGLGAFNMVRAEAYRIAGGHRALPMEVADDIKLGKVLKRSGFQTVLVKGEGLISVRWVVGLRGVIESLSKNAFAGFEYSLPREAAGLMVIVYTGLFPLIALFLPGSIPRLIALCTLVLMMAGAGAVRSLSGGSALYGLAYPLASVLLTYIIVRATLVTYLRNGVVWRGTLYPLDELRRGVV